MISKVEWEKRIEAYKLRGLSTRAWCEIQNIPNRNLPILPIPQFFRAPFQRF